MTCTFIDIAPGGHVEKLLASAHKEWEEAVTHRFVRELFAGTLDDGVLARYLVQDYQFFDAFLSMLGGCVAHADKVEPRLRFAAQLGMLANDEDGYFQKAFAELGVPVADQQAPELTDVTKDFRNMMYDAVASQSYPDLLVMLVVAEYLYLDWGERGSTAEEPAPLPERYVHSGWVELHRGEDFRQWCQFLINELERVFPDSDVPAGGNLPGDASVSSELVSGEPSDEPSGGTPTASSLTLRFQKAVALERGFFDAAYQ